MSYRWEVEDGTIEAQRAGDRRDLPAGGRDQGARAPEGGSGYRSARPRLVLVIGIALALAGLSLAGWRYWTGRELMRQVRNDVRAAVELEERALVEGDMELYMRQQSPARARQWKRAPGTADQRGLRRPPQPGLEVGDAGEILSIQPELGQERDGAVRRSTVEVRFAVSDSLGSASFLENRHYRLDAEGRWIHDLPPDAQAESNPLRWRGEQLEAWYLPADAEILPPVFERADVLLTEFCAVSAICEQPRQSPIARRPNRAADARDDRASPARLSFTGSMAGVGGGTRHHDLRFLRLPAPRLTMVPADAAADDLLLRHVLRMAVLDMVDAVSPAHYIDGYGQPLRGSQGNATLLTELLDAWIVLATGEALRPVSSSISAAPPPSHLRSSLHGLWHGDPTRSARLNSGGDADDDHYRRLTKSLVVHLASEGGVSTLARLIGGLPGETDARAWLETGFGADASEIEAGWSPRYEPFPADRAVLLSCRWGPDGQVMLQPNRAPLSLDVEACGAQRIAGRATWSPDGRALAVPCAPPQPLGDGGPDLSSGLGMAILPWPPVAGVLGESSIRYGADRMWWSGASWTADGRWLLWTEDIDGGDDEVSDLRLLALPVERVEASEAVEPVHVADIDRRSTASMSWSADEELPRGEIAPNQDRSLPRPAPLGARVAQEPQVGRIIVTDLGPGGAEPQWPAEGHDPMWSPDGDWLASMQVEDLRLELVVRDSETGRERARAEVDLREHLLALRAAIGESRDPNSWRYVLRPRVGGWSPDGRWVGLVAGAHAQTSSGAESAISVLLLLEPATGRAWEARLGGDDQRADWADALHWTDDGHAWLLSSRVVFSLLADDQVATGSPLHDPQTPVALRVSLTDGQSVARTTADVEAEGLPRRLRTNRSPDGRWEIRGDRRGGSSRAHLIDAVTGETRWSLYSNFCYDTSWQPDGN